MSFTVSSASRRTIMAVLLALAVLGGLIRYLAPDPSTLRDVGTLMLVLWVPAIGQFIGWLMGKIPRRAPPPSYEFEPGSQFKAHLQADLAPVALPDGALADLPLDSSRCTLIVGRQGFTVRLGQPVAQWASGPPIGRTGLEFLRPELALPHLPDGTVFHLLVGAVAVARGEVRQP